MTGAAFVDLELALPHIAQAMIALVTFETRNIVKYTPFALYAHF